MVAHMPLYGYPVGSVSREFNGLSVGLRRNRLVALVAACTLIMCAAAYSAHGLADRSHEHSHCDVCLHFSGCAGSPPPAAVISKPVLVVRVAPTRPEIILPMRSPLGVHLPRGPPTDLIVI
jgi:hypothetical protein